MLKVLNMKGNLNLRRVKSVKPNGNCKPKKLESGKESVNPN